jgi:hypothetical protein
VTGGWRKLHNEELSGLYSSPSIARAIKARRMRWAGHVARMGEVRGAYNILVGRPESCVRYPANLAVGKPVIYVFIVVTWVVTPCRSVWPEIPF